MSQASSSTVKKPLVALQRAMNREVRVRLKNMMEYRGLLVNVDSYMNVLLEDAFEHREDGQVSEKLGRVMIRGSNVLYVVIGEDSVP